ncbi:EVI2B protein, partial [Alopecoenas beccarii]|nr:EVI2B protein [Alopecoenas beccarii]
MANNQVILVLFYGEIWKCLSTAIPLQVSMNKRNAYTSSPREDTAPLYPRQETGPVLPNAGGAPTVAAAAPFPEAAPEPSDSSWVAALIIGIILTSMLIAIFIIVLWKCCKRPVPADSNWAGRSPFADGDTPDVFMDPDQATKRSSVLFMLPWKLKQDTNLQQDASASEKAPGCGSSQESGAGCSRASAPRPTADPPPCPGPPTGAPSSPAPPEPLDLPPPPDWLRDPAEHHGPGPGEGQERRSGPEEPLPPPHESPSQGMREPPPRLPQPQHPL